MDNDKETIVMIKLINGEVVIGLVEKDDFVKFVNDDYHWFDCHNPARMTVHVDKATGAYAGLSLEPYLIGVADEIVTLSPHGISGIAVLVEEIKTEYLRLFHASSIVVPDNKIVVA